MAEEKKQASSEPPRNEDGAKKLPLVFISHDTRDAKLAEAFSRLLSSVSCGVLKSFRSSDKKGKQGIDYGVEWYPEIISNLEKSSDVVCLLTPNSVNRPWILYEAGIAKGKRETPVYGVALGIPLGDAGTGPFAQFQNCGDDDDSLTSLVVQLLRRVPNAEPDREIVLAQVQLFKKIAAEMNKGMETEQKKPIGPVDESSTAKLFEEVKVMFNDLPSRVEGRIFESIGSRRDRRRERFHPRMFKHMIFAPSEGDDPISLLVLAGLIRDDLPCFYDVTLEVYRTIKTGTVADIASLMKTLQNSEEFMMGMRGQWMEKWIDGPEMDMMLHEFPHLLHHRLEQALKHRTATVKESSDQPATRKRRQTL
jgi:hypothetical protein